MYRMSQIQTKIKKKILRKTTNDANQMISYEWQNID